MTKVGLGTIQLGLPYGNAATKPLMSLNESFSILQHALDRGICFFDTAQAYGESERRLGQFGIGSAAPNIEVSTKVKRVSKDIWSDVDKYYEFVAESCRTSRRLLGVESLGLLQFHQCEIDFLSSASTQSVFQRLLETGVCREIGVSVYQPVEAEYCTELPFIHALQVPVNIVDKRFITTALTTKYKSAGLRLIGRSIFLQGALLPYVPLPPVKKAPLLDELRKILWSGVEDHIALKSCLSAVFKDPSVSLDVALIGADSMESIVQTMDAFDGIKDGFSIPTSINKERAMEFAHENKMADPSSWNV